MDLFYVFSHQIQKWKVYQWMFRITKHKNDKKKKKKKKGVKHQDIKWIYLNQL